MSRNGLLLDIETFLGRHLPVERKLSRSTILSYRDALKIFLEFQMSKSKKTYQFQINDLNYDNITSFLEHVETFRKGSITTRNHRLAVIKSLCKFMLIRHPEFADTLSRVLAVPRKRPERKRMAYLEKNEIHALLSSIDGFTWTAQRNHLMFHFALSTGLRVSELTGLMHNSFVFGNQPYIIVKGKGRKERCVPISKVMANKITKWISQSRAEPQFLFSTRTNSRMSSDAVQFALKKAVTKASIKCPSIKRKKVSVHTLRHTAAMQMLERGVDIYIIALWLGHESVETTQVYLSESMRLKRKALQRFRIIAEPPKLTRSRSELSFLDDL